MHVSQHFMEERLAEIAALPVGWGDDPAADAVDARALAVARLVLADLHRRDLAMPKIYASSTGGVDMEWGYDIILTILYDELIVTAMPPGFVRADAPLPEDAAAAAGVVLGIVSPALRRFKRTA